MSQAKLSSYYGTRKRRTDKLVTDIKNDAKIIDYQDSLTNITLSNAKVIKELSKRTELSRESAKLVNTKSSDPSPLTEAPDVSKQDLKTSKSKIPRIKSTRTKAKKQAKVTDNDGQNADIRKSFRSKGDNQAIAKPYEELEIKPNEELKIKPNEEPEIKVGDKLEDKPAEELEDKLDKNETVLNSTYTITEDTPKKSEAELIRTPKRNLSNPDAANSDSKKKKRIDPSVSSLVKSAVTGNEAPSVETPNKRSIRKSLFSDYKSDSLAKNDSESSLEVQSTSIGTNPKRPPISPGKLSGFKDRLSRLNQLTNKCKTTSVIASDDHKRPDAATQEPKPCHIEHRSLIAAKTTLALPNKYRLLSDAFQCSDTIMSMLNNRKEVCTFDKLKNGIEKMTKRAFTRTHLGQIKTIFPHAYNYNIEKNSASVMNRKPGTPQYELVIAPNMAACNPKGKETVSPSSDDNATKSGAFQAMTPAHLIERKNSFAFNLLNIVKKHHQNFLAKLDPPLHVPIDKLTKWHPKFRLDSLPDIEPSELPESPNKTKVGTALDLLNKIREAKIRGSAGERIEKALQAVVKENAERTNNKVVPETKTPVTKKLPKYICADLLQRIRARESAKIVEDMTQDPKEQKRKAMMERIPEIVRILRTYFIQERRAAISLEIATQKIVDSYHSAMNAEDVCQHLHLIANTFPEWLTMIPIRKSLFLKIDKNRDINVLLDSIPK